MQATVILNQSAFSKALEKDVAKEIRLFIRNVKLEIWRSFQLPKHGREYRRPRFVGGGVYRASAKGEAPAIRTTNLFSALFENFPLAFIGVLEIDTSRGRFQLPGDYQNILESPSGLDRPFVKPALEKMIAAQNAGLLRSSF